ncbi:hypothetical protein C482_03346 [Natrialba chahannaoensis JCM 10990]|uniref:Small CPxCG-related zinc finger protein n=1 Tax=Natrialba chahannaoensis JCM 10990 TaxID=1227492 RepID=M0B2K7_9EURY|nr:hypothetical protein C482_03346 [Natrialba chahannaoensis JCM 10990]
MSENEASVRPESISHREHHTSAQPEFVFTCDACQHQIEVDDSVAAAIVRHGCPICGIRATTACLRRVADTPPPDH